MRVRLTATAAAEVDDILTFLKGENPTAARRVAAKLEDTLGHLQRFPYSASATDDPEVRMAIVGRYPYLIFYTITDDELVIRNVRHAARRRSPDVPP